MPSSRMATNVESSSLVGIPKSLGNTIENKRGYNVYHVSDLIGITGRDKSGQWVNGKYTRPLFNLTIEEREEIANMCDVVFGLISSRCNRISSLDWNVVPKTMNEDRIAQQLKDKYAVYTEFYGSDDIKYKIAGLSLLKDLRSELSDLLPDGSNFSRALSRWSRKIKTAKQDFATQIENWLEEPNSGDNWLSFSKKMVYDLLVHGSIAVYKQVQDSKVENIYTLPGGSVFPFISDVVGGPQGYIQLVDAGTPAIFFNDEISFSNYLPYSARPYGMVPLEALVNKIAESMLFDKLMAEQADGTKVPNKWVIFADKAPFGSDDVDFGSVPIDTAESKRIETKLNTARKYAIGVLTGTGSSTPTVLDLSRENTMTIQNQRQKEIKEAVALVFNASNLEVNKSDSDGVSGRATSESLETIDQNRGIIPIARLLESVINKTILPFRYGSGYNFEFVIGKDEKEEVALLTQKKNSGLWTRNELRTQDLGMDPFADTKYDQPEDSQQTPDGSEANPLFTMGM